MNDPIERQEAHFYLEELQRMMTQHRGIFSEEFVRANGMAIQALEQERKKGKWVHGKEIAREYLAGRITCIEYKDYHCSECGYTVENIRWNVDGELVDKYCTVCGAQMEVRE